MQLLIDTLAEIWFAIVILYDVKTLIDGLHVFQGEDQPASQQSPSHRRDGLVDDIQQRLAIILHRMDQFKAADGEFIQTDILIFLNAGDAGDMAYLGVLRLFKID